MLPSTGEPAPDFTLPSTAGHDVTLSSFRGVSAVLINFFPLAFTSTCTAQMCDFTAEFERFVDSGVAVLPISVDATASLREYKAKYNLRSELLSDFRRDVSRLYGVLNEDRFYSNRAYFLIDRAGILRWSYMEELNRNKRSNDELLSRIAQLD